MKTQIPDSIVKEFVRQAQNGEGRETEAGGGNFRIDITILKADLDGFPELQQRLAGGTFRVFLNKDHQYVGHKVLGPQPKKKGVTK